MPLIVGIVLVLVLEATVLETSSVFRIVDLNLSDFFRLFTDNRNRGHQYNLLLPCHSSSARYNFLVTDRAAHGRRMAYQLTLTLPALTVLNVVLVPNFQLHTLTNIFSSRFHCAVTD